MKSRSVFLYIFFLIFTAAVIARLFSLQILNHEVYQALADNQHQLFEKLVPVRGEISIAEGQGGKTVSVVTNIEKNLVYGVPPEIGDKTGTAAKLSVILGVPKNEILAKISDNSRKWVAIQKELPEDVSLSIQKLKLAGIYLEAQTYRTYPEGAFASQILGFLGNKDGQPAGQYGIEEYFNSALGGKAGSLKLDKDLSGAWITTGLHNLQPAQDGADITLTIDRAIQFKAEQILKDTVEKYQADNASMVIISPKTGAVLGMATYPTFDPNSFNTVTDQAVYRNRAVSDAYEPGSVFKAVTMAAGLEAGAITPDTTYEDTGSITLNGFTIRNALNKVHGVQTMTQVLEQSINTGAIYAEQHTGNQQFADMVKNFGFGAVSGVTLPAESSGNIASLSKSGDVFYATAAFGQGITVTPFQLAAAYAAIANQGKLMKPFIVQSISYADGHTDTTQPQEVRQVISPKTAAMLSAMLVSVVELGHGEHAQVPGYYMAGKTGTAQVARTDGKGYDPNTNIGTFAGFGPVEDPAFAIVVKVYNPKAAQFAEISAAPAFGLMAQFLVNYFQIPPTRQ
jgi:cell division protein FtsI/penicillin-binding protein 2